MTVNDNPRIKMTFRVEPLDGSPAFDTTKGTTVHGSRSRGRVTYPVWYDAPETSKWMYATIADESGRETMRQLFGDVANTFVGMGAPETPMAAALQGQAQDTVE